MTVKQIHGMQQMLMSQVQIPDIIGVDQSLCERVLSPDDDIDQRMGR